MLSKNFVIYFLFLTLGLECFAGPKNKGVSSEIVPAGDVKWGYLNPARGDKGPRAADLWGDRTKDTASGILLQFPAGFSSPPHIHNITYRGVVISGALHNDDPGAKNMWLPAGSFWTQPAGEAHITAAKGSRNIAYIEIDSGPYLVQPVAKAFDNGERPVNIDPSNIVWLSGAELTGVPGNKVKKTYLWGDTTNGELYGSMIKLPENFTGKIQASGITFKAIVVVGSLKYKLHGKEKNLQPGSYFGSSGVFEHEFSIKNKSESIVYIRSNGKYEVLLK